MRVASVGMVLGAVVAVAGCSRDLMVSESNFTLVSPAGAIVRSADAKLSLDVPEGAVAEELEVAVSVVDVHPEDAASRIYLLEPRDQILAGRAIISIQLRDDAPLVPGAPYHYGVAIWTDEGIEPVAPSSYDATTRTAQASITMLGAYGVFLLMPSPPCDPSPCVHGSCVQEGDEPLCVCEVGFEGTYCDVSVEEPNLCPIDAALTPTDLPCMCRGERIESTNGMECLCSNAAGLICPVPECYAGDEGDNYCALTYGAGYRCAGSHCALGVTSCNPNPCAHGLCVVDDNASYCNCDVGWTGVLCDTPVNSLVQGELERLGLTATSEPATDTVDLPEEFTDAMWSARLAACSAGGYNLAAYAGQTVARTSVLIAEQCDGESVQAWVMSTEEGVVCAYLAVLPTSGMAPGVFAVNASACH